MNRNESIETAPLIFVFDYAAAQFTARRCGSRHWRGSNVMRKLSVLVLLMISACTALNPEVIWRIAKLKEKIAKDTIVVDRRINEQRPNVELGFVVYMNTKEAQKMGAPSGVGFIKLLDERVTQEERLIGHKICLHGYKISNREPSIGEGGDWDGVWMVGFDCNP